MSWHLRKHKIYVCHHNDIFLGLYNLKATSVFVAANCTFLLHKHIEENLQQVVTFSGLALECFRLSRFEYNIYLVSVCLYLCIHGALSSATSRTLSRSFGQYNKVSGVGFRSIYYMARRQTDPFRHQPEIMNVGEEQPIGFNSIYFFSSTNSAAIILRNRLGTRNWRHL